MDDDLKDQLINLPPDKVTCICDLLDEVFLKRKLGIATTFETVKFTGVNFKDVCMMVRITKDGIFIEIVYMNKSGGCNLNVVEYDVIRPILEQALRRGE